MNIYQTTVIRFLWIALVLAVLMGCGGKPAAFKQTAGEMKEGPGVLTGEEGAFVVYDSEKGGGFWERSKEKSEEAADKPHPATSDKTPEATQIAAGQTSKGTQVTPEEAKEFQEFQQWKKEQQSFKEFQQWKKSEAGKAEYQEFLKWKEWKSYQEWKKQQDQ